MELRVRAGADGHHSHEAFLSVAEAAQTCRVSEMTLYRAIQAGEFPAVRIRGRIIVPGQVLQAMAEHEAFLSVAEAAQACRVSGMTLYRAIQAGEFPAVRIRGRIIVPGQVLQAMAEAAMETGLVDAADWVVRNDPLQGDGDGRPGVLPRQLHRLDAARRAVVLPGRRGR